MGNDKKNAEGYYDPTAYEAIKSASSPDAAFEVYRGDVFYIRNVKDYFTGDNKPERPAIVVSNDTGNHFSQMIEVVFLTSKTDRKPLPTHVEVICKVPSIAKCEQIETVSKDRLGGFIRSCNIAEMAAIDKALMISLGIVNRDSSDTEKDDIKSECEEKQRCIDPLSGGLQRQKQEEEFIRLETERNLYKTLYEQAISTMIGMPREVRT